MASSGNNLLQHAYNARIDKTTDDDYHTCQIETRNENVGENHIDKVKQQHIYVNTGAMYSSVPTKEFDARIGSAKNMGLLLLFLLFFFLSISCGRNTYQTTIIVT